MESDWWSVKVLADTFHVSEQTVRLWLRQRRVPHIRLPNGEFRVRSTDVEKYLARTVPAAKV
jgi:excisionase family DNA binding protein